MQNAYLSYDRFPAAKGAAVHIAAFVEALAANFGELDLYTVSPNPDAPPASLAHSVRHIPIDALGTNMIDRVLCFRAQLGAKIRERLQGQRYDIVHVRSIYEGLPLALHKKQFCKRLVVEINGLPSIELKYHYPDVADDEDLLKKLRWQEQRLMEAADLILTVSEVNASHLRSRGIAEDRIQIIPNGVDCDVFSYQRPRRWPLEHVKLLYSGTMSPWQGVLQAIEALALYRRDHSAELHLAGESRPRQRKELREACYRWEVADAVHFHGPVTQQELAALHHQADVVLAPLRSQPPADA